ncbi:hypothetical protein SUGI_0291570 [Cryptomeria japonica]|nr:hypothetical protein SUGI_0291570 [Cryptomeria japonica]
MFALRLFKQCISKKNYSQCHHIIGETYFSWAHLPLVIGTSSAKLEEIRNRKSSTNGGKNFSFDGAHWKWQEFNWKFHRWAQCF